METAQLFINLIYSVVGFGLGYLFAHVAERRRNGNRDGS